MNHHAYDILPGIVPVYTHKSTFACSFVGSFVFCFVLGGGNDWNEGVQGIWGSPTDRLQYYHYWYWSSETGSTVSSDSCYDNGQHCFVTIFPVGADSSPTEDLPKYLGVPLGLYIVFRQMTTVDHLAGIVYQGMYYVFLFIQSQLFGWPPPVKSMPQEARAPRKPNASFLVVLPLSNRS